MSGVGEGLLLGSGLGVCFVPHWEKARRPRRPAAATPSGAVTFAVRGGCRGLLGGRGGSADVRLKGVEWIDRYLIARQED